MLKRKIEGDTILFCDGATTVLAVREEETPDGILLTFDGQLRSDVANDILDELIALTTVGADICADLAKVSYMAPTVQHNFLRVQQKMDAIGKGTLTLRNLPDAIYQEFEKAGTSELLMIEN